MVWLVVQRPERPDATVWPGRRWLAVADALGWALAGAGVLVFLVPGTGVVGPVVAVAAILLGLRAAHVGWARNHRYRFATARLGVALAVLLALGLALRLLVQ